MASQGILPFFVVQHSLLVIFSSGAYFFFFFLIFLLIFFRFTKISRFLVPGCVSGFRKGWSRGRRRGREGKVCKGRGRGEICKEGMGGVEE